MKFISKIARTVVMAAIGMVAPVGVALAQETYAVTKYEYMKADGAETNGLTFGLSGRYTSGFSYDMELLSTGTGGASMTGADIDLGYRVGGIAGPMTIYEYRDVAGGGSDQVLFGIEGGTEIFETQASARLLFDTDDQDVYRLGIGAKHDINADFSVSGEMTHFENGSLLNVNRFEVGVRYRVLENMHADIGAHHEARSGSADHSGFSLGLGFSF